MSSSWIEDANRDIRKLVSSPLYGRLLKHASEYQRLPSNQREAFNTLYPQQAHVLRVINSIRESLFEDYKEEIVQLLEN